MTAGPTYSYNFPPTVIKASAGSGKTRAISDRYLSLLVAGEKPDRILATTFTKKAAGEIKERVIKRLVDAILDNGRLVELRDSLRNPSLSRAQIEDLLFRLVKDLHRLQITTLDSFFIKIAKSFCFELGLSANWQIGEESDQEQIKEEATRALCSSLGYAELALIIGKFGQSNAERKVHKLILDEVGYLRQLVRSSEIGAWKWFNEAPEVKNEQIINALECLKNVDLPISKSTKKPHSGWQKAVDDLSALGSSGSWHTLLDKGLLNAYLSGSGFHGHPLKADLQSILSVLVASAKYSYCSQIIGRLKSAYLLGAHFSNIYEKLLFVSQRFNFDEIKDILTKLPLKDSLEEIYFRLDSRIAHVLLDEFQDTSLAEWVIVEPLVAEILAKSGDGTNSFFCVGDVKQAIYGWRGGVAEIFNSLTDAWPHLEQITFETSYRSSAEIIDAVNQVFSNVNGLSVLNEYTGVASEWADRFNTHNAARSDLQGHVAFYSVPAEEEGSLYLYVVDKLKQLISAGTYSEIGILVRDHKTLAHMIGELKSAGVDASEEGGNRVKSSLAVQSIISLLTLLDHPSHTIAYYHVAVSPLGEKIGMRVGMSPYDINKILIELRRAIEEKGLGAVVNSWIKFIADSYDSKEMPYLLRLGELAFAYQDKLGLRFRDFLKFIESKKAENTSNSPIKVMTIHKSKGLEFDCVILPDLDFKIVDHSKRPSFLASRDNPLSAPTKIAPQSSKLYQSLFPELKEIQKRYESEVVKESLSLLYVALTRAKRGLYMFSGLKKNKSGKDPILLTFGNILRESLAESVDPESEIVYQRGNWDELSPQDFKPERGDVSNTAKAPISISFGGVQAPSLPLHKRGRQVIAPSHLSGGGAVNLKDIFSTEGSRNKEEGTILHRMLEAIDWIPSECELDNFLKNQIQFLDLGSAPNALIFQKLVQALNDPRLRALFTRSTYEISDRELVLLKEWRFAYHKDNKIVNGVVDRLVLLKHGEQCTFAEIIDFKGGDSLSKNESFYKPQLEAYKEAVNTVFAPPKNGISTKIVHIEGKAILEI